MPQTPLSRLMVYGTAKNGPNFWPWEILKDSCLKPPSIWVGLLSLSNVSCLLCLLFILNKRVKQKVLVVWFDSHLNGAEQSHFWECHWHGKLTLQVLLRWSHFYCQQQVKINKIGANGVMGSWESKKHFYHLERMCSANKFWAQARIWKERESDQIGIHKAEIKHWDAHPWNTAWNAPFSNLHVASSFLSPEY